MNYTGDSAGPSRPKKSKTQNKVSSEEEIQVLFVKMSEDSPSCFSANSDSDDELFSCTTISESESDDDDDDDDYDFEEEAGCQVNDAPTAENVIWENNSTSMKEFPFLKSECLLQPITGDSPVDYFRHFLTDGIVEEIVTEINNYAREVLFRGEEKMYSVNAWKDTTKEELLVFLGLLLHMGTIRMNRIQDYWKTDSLFGLRVFSQNMSRNRFALLLKALNFSKIPEENKEPPKDRLYKIRNMVNFFNSRVSEVYYPGREICLREALVLWRGRLTRRQCIPNERRKNYIKLYMVTTPDGMVLKFLVDDSSGKGCAQKVVMNLLEGFLNVGHSVFMDSCYNSYELARCLADRKTHCTGTIRKNRKEIPKILNEKKLKKGESVAMYANGVLIGKWQDARDITYISNEFKNDTAEKQGKAGEIIPKPVPIIQIDRIMEGVEKQDQMFAYYPCDRITSIWPTKIIVHILQMMMSNAHFIYRKYSNGNTSLYDYRLSVIRSLLKQSSVLSAPPCDSSESEHVLSVREEKRNGKILRKQCKSCYSKGKRKETIYICKFCDGSPGYCLDCAKIIHK